MKIRLTTFARPDQDLLNRFSKRYMAGRIEWENLQFVTDNSYDRLVIFTFPYSDTMAKGYEIDKALTFMTEPKLSPFAIPHPTGKIMDFHLHLPFLPDDFVIDKQLKKNILNKHNLLSVIVSELAALPGHKARLSFIYSLDKYINDGLDVFGRPVNGEFFNILDNYRGFLPDKYSGLWSYQYHFACENCSQEGYFTEKIIDPLMTETLCFYNGCPDIENYIDPNAYIKIDVNDLENSIPLIAKSIQDNEWKKKLPFIRQEKRRFLTSLHPLNIIRLAAHDEDISTLYKL